MSKISRMSYTNLGYMIDSAVGAGILDRASGRAYLPDTFLFKMQSLAERYREQRTRYAKLTGHAQDIRDKREALSPFLAKLVRNIHASFNRFYKGGKVSQADIIAFQIPKEASRQPGNRLKIWLDFGQTIVRIYNKRKSWDRDPLPPYVLSDATVDILTQHLNEAEKVHLDLKRQVAANIGEHSHLLKLRKEVVRTLELVKRHLELSLYEKPDSIRRLALATYGMLLPDGKGKTHMLGPDMKPPPQATERTKATEDPPPPKAEAPPQEEPATKAEPEPTPQPELKPEDSSHEVKAEQPEPLPEQPMAKAEQGPQTTVEKLEALLEKIKSGKKIRGKQRKIRRLREQIEAEKQRSNS